MKYLIYDVPKQGIDLEFDFETGIALKVFLDYKSAQEMVDIIQNKLNGVY